MIHEYLSNNTSDFSDGTNGEPSAPGRYTGDTGAVAGLPDYKYLERKKARREKLRALLQRRDPDAISANPMDKELRASLGEQRLSSEEMAILKSQTRRRRRLRPPTREDLLADASAIVKAILEDEPGAE